MLSGSSSNVIIVGAGPIGLAHAWGIKKLNPSINVVVLEKYEEYQRKHTLVMQHEQLSKLMHVTGTEEDPALSNLLEKIKRDPHIRTSELEETFRKIARDNGVTIVTEKVKKKTINQQLFREDLPPSLIIGADGTHSVVSRGLFPEGNQVKHEFDYVLQLRYEIEGESKESERMAAIFYQSMARHGLIANEYIGRFSQGKTPVTMQMMISRESFYALQRATSKKPIRPYKDKDKDEAHKIKSSHEPPSEEIADSKQNDFPNILEDLQWDDLPLEFKAFISSYIKEKVKHSGCPLDPASIRISVNEAPATHAKKVAHVNDSKEHKNVPLLLVGDAGLGLSYFKGLNAGLESTAMLLSLLTPAIQAGLSSQKGIMTALANYQIWFLDDFAPKKVAEVAQYSTWRIRPGIRAMQVARNIKGFSVWEDDHDEMPIITSYFQLLAKDSLSEESTKKKWRPYPHRQYELVKFGQVEYVPIKHTAIKIGKLFIDYVKPYKSGFQFRQDLKQPLVGLVNLGVGLGKIVVGTFTLDKWQIGDGLFSSVRGALELVTTPLAWTLKPIIRGLATLISGKPMIEENAGIKRLVKDGLRQLTEEKDSQGELSTEKIYKLFAVCDDLHRKFSKSLKRNQHTHIKKLEESTEYSAARSSTHDKSKCREQFRKYFLLFSKNIQVSQTTADLHSKRSPTPERVT